MPLPQSAPKKVGRYRLLAPIARGGAATVYLGRSEGIGGFKRIVAVKLLHPHLLEDAASQAADEFIEEAKLSARMQHPMIVPVMDVGQSDEGFYLVMDYVDGASLSELMRKANRALPTRITLRILYDVLQGLQAAHTAKDEKGRDLGIVHRDFSPQNILVGTDGRSRLTDFGIARATTRAEYTRTGLVKGKVAYMSPEQAEGKPLDGRTDVWAAGVVAWELFAGRRMYPQLDPMPMMLRIINDPPPRLRSVNAECPQSLDDALERALRRDLPERTASALDLRNSILEAAGGESQMASPEEVGEFVANLNIERLNELRSIVQDASESRSAAPPGGPLPVGPRESTTRVEPSLQASNESGTFTTTSAEKSSAAASTASVDQILGSRNKRISLVAGSAALLIGAAFALFSGPDPSEQLVEIPRAVVTDTGKSTAAKGESAPPSGEAEAEQAKADTKEDEEIPLPGEPEPEPRSELVISAQEPFTSLRVGNRSIILPRPESSVTVRLLDAERFDVLAIEAITRDGRKAKAELPEDESELELEFVKAKPRSVRRPITSTKTTTKKRKSDLAASPY